MHQLRKISFFLIKNNCSKYYCLYQFYFYIIKIIFVREYVFQYRLHFQICFYITLNKKKIIKIMSISILANKKFFFKKRYFFLISDFKEQY